MNESHNSEINPKLKAYIESEILPRYEKFYSHGPIHIQSVVRNTLMLAEYYRKDYDVAYTAAVYHDLGLKVDREHHELASGEIVASDANLKTFFSNPEIQIIREAVEDHRGSRKTPPRNFYGEIISDSDRDFDIEVLAPRQLATSIKNYPELNTFDDHFNRCYEYMLERTQRTGHFHLWTNNPILAQRRDQFERDYHRRDFVYQIYSRAYQKMQQEGIIDKIQDYYEDF